MRSIREPGASIAVSLSDVGSQPDVGEIELMVLATVAPIGSKTGAIAQQLEQPAETIQEAVQRLVRAGLLEATGDSVTLTQTGQLAAATVRGSWPIAAAGELVSTIDLSEVGRFVGSLWPADPGRAAAEETARAGLLASDADRDVAVHQLSEAFSQGRLSASELEQRTGSALSARTCGELDAALEGLGGLQRPVRNHPVRKVLFWVASMLFSPFVLLGSLLLAFGTDAGDRLGGVAFLAVLLPPLFGLWRWAWPRG